MAKLSFSEKLKSLFGKKNEETEDFFEDLTDSLIEGDLGAKTAFELTEKIESLCKKQGTKNPAEITALLKQELSSFVKDVEWEEKDINVIGSCTGQDLELLTTKHPLIDRKSPIILGILSELGLLLRRIKMETSVAFACLTIFCNASWMIL